MLTRLITLSLASPLGAIQLNKKSDLQQDQAVHQPSVDFGSLDGVLHWVDSCDQCGLDSWCNGGDWSADLSSISLADYTIGLSLEDWGCTNVEQNAEIVRDSDSGAIYAVEKPIIHHVSNCNQCDGTSNIGGSFNWCSDDVGQWEKNQPNVEAGYTVGDDLATWGCDNAYGGAVRNSDSGAIYAVETLSGGVLHHISTCDQCGGNWCSTYASESDSIETYYTSGMELENWGCNNMPLSPITVRNPDSGAIYVVGPFPTPAPPTPSPTTPTPTPAPTSAPPTPPPAAPTPPPTFGKCNLQTNTCDAKCSQAAAAWPQKCTWDDCAGCSDCATIDTCMDWCADNASPWGTKCTWACCHTCLDCA